MTPSNTNKECKRLYEKETVSWTEQYIDEINIVDRKSKLITKCYMQYDNNNHGWCGTNQGNDLKKQKFSVSKTSGWGFCKKDCFPEQKQEQMGVPRYSEDVYVLEDTYCENLMAQKLEYKKIKKYKVAPKILCVGKNKTHNSITYRKHRGKYQLIDDDPHKWYIVGKLLFDVI